MMELKIKIGFVVRGIKGYFQNHLESHPETPSAIAVSTIGLSVKGSWIVCYKLGDGPVPIIFVCGIHGNEVGAVKLGYYLTNWLSRDINNYQRFTFYIIPSLNPDGYEVAKQHPDYFGGGRQGRFNANQVDLNRNFPTPSFKTESVWSTGKNYSEEIKVFCGNSPGSEPEIQALIKFIKDKQIKTYIAFHSVAGDVMANDNLQAQKMADAFAKASGYFREPPDHWAKLNQTGTAKEYCDQQNIAYLEIESRYRWSTDWEAHKRRLEAVLKML